MSNEKDGLRIQSAESESFMGTENTVIDIGGRSLVVTGKNETGKSRLFQLLLSGIDSKNQASEVITKGETSAWTKVVIAGEIGGEPEEYKIEMFFTAKNKKGRIVVKDKNDEDVKSPKEILKGLIGNISFDMFKFINDKKDNQIKILKELSGVRVEIDKNEMARKEVFDKRTALNNVIERDETLMNNHGFAPEEIDLFSESIEIEPIQLEMDNISPKITSWNKVKTGTDEFKVKYKKTIPGEISKVKLSITTVESQIKDKEAQIEKLKQEIEGCKTTITTHNETIGKFETEAADSREKRMKGLLWLRKNPEPNVKNISARLTAANLHNQKHEKVKELAEKQKNLIKDKQTAMKYTAEIEAFEKAKDKLIAGSKLPIKGLTFTDEEIFYNGLPLEDRQVNTATLYDIGFEISKALNPMLKVIFIRAASLFDSAHLKAVVAKARKQGYQVIAERVTDDEKREITFIEMEE